jgi:hypothetical protein
MTETSRPPGPWDENAAPTPAPNDVSTRAVNQKSAPSDAAFGDCNQAARNAAARVDAEAAEEEKTLRSLRRRPKSNGP